MSDKRINSALTAYCVLIGIASFAIGTVSGHGTQILASLVLVLGVWPLTLWLMR